MACAAGVSGGRRRRVKCNKQRARSYRSLQYGGNVGEGKLHLEAQIRLVISGRVTASSVGDQWRGARRNNRNLMA